MTKTIKISDIITELNEIKRPKANDYHVIKSLDCRKYTNVNRIKSFFKLIKRQGANHIKADFKEPNEIKVLFNLGNSEYHFRSY